MSRKRKRSEPKPEVTFESACSLLEAAFKGPSRREIVEGLSEAGSLENALLRLRDAMRTGSFRARGQEIHFQRTIHKLDRRTREDGFHVLHDWDGKADKLNEETIPVDVVTFMVSRTSGGDEKKVLAILLDYYFFYVLALLALRAWDEGSPDDNLDRVSRLLEELQAEDGSGQKFVGGAEALLPIATSHFEPDVRAFERLLERVKTLNETHRTRVALVYAGILGSHLRFGFEAAYGRDILEMRKDNAPDYSWLSFALATLIAAYERMEAEAFEGAERERIVEGLLNGLSPDARAFLGNPPTSLAPHEAERARFSELFRRYEPSLLQDFERHRPSEEHYSPISFFFNFPHNTLKAIVVDALLRGEPWDLTLDDLLTGIPRDAGARRKLAETLMGYARASPDTLRGRPVPAIVYDPRSGLRAFADALERVRAPASARGTGRSEPP